MTPTQIKMPAKTLVGLKVRTKNADEMNPKTAKIGPLVAAFKSLGQNQPLKDTYCVYTDYESDFNGTYTFFIGVSSNETPKSPFETLYIPEQTYLKFTPPRGPMPQVVIEAWQEIWSQEIAGKLGGQRAYQTDFEHYSAEEMDLERMKTEIFIGISDENGHK